MTGRSPLIVGTVLLAIALVATLPLRLVLPNGYFTARVVSGSIWSGQLEDVRLGRIALGTMRAAYRPLARLRVSSDSGLTAEIGWGGRLSNLNGIVAASGALAPFPVEAIEFRQVSVSAGKSGCSEAEGRVRLTLSSAGSGLPPGAVLVGPLRCTEGDLTTRLVSQSGLDTLDLRFRSDRRFQAAMTVRPADQEAITKLQALGFRQSPTGYQLTVSGRF